MINLLKSEESPYLRQHQEDPIEWYSWGKEAFEKARREDKLIFVSIGYSSCHWCHVMQKESFKNEEIAKKLNDNFVSIKVDKEERPDIDRYFQEIFMKMNKKPGGWPLSMFITYDKIPVYSATYLPPTPKYGLMGLSELLDILVLKYRSERDKLLKNGMNIVNSLKPKSKIEATKINDSLINISTKQIKQVYDSRFGGFGTAPKFPHTYTLNLAINLYKLTGDIELKEIVENSLNNMLKGGLHDIVDGGFCRYSTDEMWLIPHFEKMSYDNGLIADTLLKAYLNFDKEIYRDVAFKTLDFMIGKMSRNNLFFSASDADSDGDEGRYFTYQFDEVEDRFLEEGLDLEILSKLNIKEEGDFEGYSIARVDNILLFNDSDIQKGIEILNGMRKDREYPFIDDKIITSWNSMVIVALFNASKIDERYLNIAQDSINALENKMLKGNTLFHSALISNPPKIEGFLEDYAWFIKALITAYEATLDEIYLIKATNLTNEAIKRFYRGGFWSVGGDEFESFEADTDASMPSALAVMVHNLLTLRSLVDSIYEKFAFFTVEVNSYNIMRQPISRPTLTDATVRYLKDDIIVKSDIKNLVELIGFKFNYPYTFLKVTESKDIELCTNKACYGLFKTIGELKGHI